MPVWPAAATIPNLATGVVLPIPIDPLTIMLFPGAAVVPAYVPTLIDPNTSKLLVGVVTPIPTLLPCVTTNVGFDKLPVVRYAYKLLLL